MKRFAMVIAMGGMAVMTALPALASTMTMNGFISGSKCGATHMVNPSQCVKKCISEGQKPVFVDGQKNVWKIDNPAAVPVSDEGRHVKITADAHVATKTLHIVEIQKTMKSKIKSKI